MEDGVVSLVGENVFLIFFVFLKLFIFDMFVVFLSDSRFLYGIVKSNLVMKMKNFKLMNFFIK